MRGNLNDNQAKINNADKAVRAALKRKRKIIMQSKQIAYDMLSELYGKDGQELVDAVTADTVLSRSLPTAVCPMPTLRDLWIALLTSTTSR